jgi:hypothetical protein
MRTLRLIGIFVLYWVGWASFNIAYACGRTSARLWIVDHPEPPPALDDADNAPVELLDQIERGEPERRTFH